MLFPGGSIAFSGGVPGIFLAKSILGCFLQGFSERLLITHSIYGRDRPCV